jgi:hypothetical protein
MQSVSVVCYAVSECDIQGTVNVCYAVSVVMNRAWIMNRG